MDAVFFFSFAKAPGAPDCAHRLLQVAVATSAAF
jgi:hypothetical protein